MRSLSTSAFGQPSETKLTLGARSACGEGCRFSMAEGLPERVAGSKPARSTGGSPSLNIHDFSLYRRCCSRPSFRPRMYRRKRGRGQRGPAGRNLRRVFICQVPVPGCARQRLSALALKKPPPPISSRKRENKPFRYLHTAANEPRRWVARRNRNAAALAARGAMMLILKYFLVVGAALTLGLIALNAHLLPDGSKPPAAVIHSATTASLPTVAPNVPPPEASVAAEPVQPPAKSAAPTRRSHHSARVQRRSH